MRHFLVSLDLSCVGRAQLLLSIGKIILRNSMLVNQSTSRYGCRRVMNVPFDRDELCFAEALHQEDEHSMIPHCFSSVSGNSCCDTPVSVRLSQDVGVFLLPSSFSLSILVFFLFV